MLQGRNLWPLKWTFQLPRPSRLSSSHLEIDIADLHSEIDNAFASGMMDSREEDVLYHAKPGC